MSGLFRQFELKKIAPLGLSPAEQRRLWFRNFIKAFLAIYLTYACMYLIRTNFKAAQPSLKADFGISTLELGYIGLAFSLTYAVGKVILGYTIDGRNTKKIISALLICGSVVGIVFGLALSAFGAVVGLFLVLWALNGLFQSVGGPASCNTVYRWVPRKRRALYMGIWNTSHNIGGALAGAIALWGANVFFDGHVAGMFIFPAIIGLVIGALGYFWGKDDPEELGWNRCEEIFEEPVEEENVAAESMTKWQVFKKYTIANPLIWVLCVANVFAYVLRIGVDNWAPLYVTEQLHFSKEASVNTIFYFEMGALIGTPLWGIVTGWLKGRNAVVGIGGLVGVAIGLVAYQQATTELVVNASLFMVGLLVFAPLFLIPVAIVDMVPKRGLSVSNGMAGLFGYMFGDSMAKVGLAAIADPKRDGLNIFGWVLHGWGSVFSVMYVACVVCAALLVVVAVAEERKIRFLSKAAKANSEEKMKA
ncbi:hexose-6-phosphate:phosphate antiporter [Rothia koreensis]|jgi:OPA family hexose phosphate transport protein UhpT-like MFS transporter|uniref:hexose-6-phosphate:phosphate antiporter n=1 Tax=Rothia koreensis TaxID=592378 RepID=UPI0037C80366